MILTNTENEYTKVSKRMREATDSFGLSVPTFGLERKVVAMEFFKYKDNVTVRNIQNTCATVALRASSFANSVSIIWP